ncbi:MAG: geranylgeranyl reductase family protein [Ilumatobacteraceae bacterium]
MGAAPATRSDTRRASTTDVLIVGGGPAGATAAVWLARLGHHVTVVERRVFPRSKACGDVLTPRAVRQLRDLAVEPDDLGWHRLGAVRLERGDRSLELPWPSHDGAATFAVVARRRELDVTMLDLAAAAGAEVRSGHDAVEPIVTRGFVRGAIVRSPGGALHDIPARYVLVADGANSPFGRSLGTFRTRRWPFAAAIRSYWPSPHTDDGALHLGLDLRDRAGAALPGYGWVAPVGDGTVNIGVGLLSTARDFKGTNVAHLLDGFVAQVADRWQIDPAGSTGVVRVGRVPMGGSVQPTAGPTFLVVGDAAGVASPFTGAGIDAAMETGRMAADVLHDALADAGPTALQRYPRLVADTYAEQYQLARLWGRVLGRPAAMTRVTAAAVRSRLVSETLLRIMSGALRRDEFGAPETVARLASTVLPLAPEA